MQFIHSEDKEATGISRPTPHLYGLEVGTFDLRVGRRTQVVTEVSVCISRSGVGDDGSRRRAMLWLASLVPPHWISISKQEERSIH